LRRLAVAFLVLLAICIVAVVIGPRILPKSTTNDASAAVLERLLGYPVTIAGSSELSLLPTIRLAADGISARVSARGGKDTPALFEIGSLIIEIDALSLLYNRVRIETVRIENPVLRPYVDADGTANWRPRRRAEAKDATAHLDRDWGWWDQFDIGEVQMLGGRLRWVDRVRNWRLEADRVGLASSKPHNTTAGPGFALSGNARINGEPVSLRLETGPISKALAGGRFPLVIDVTGAVASLRYQGAAAKRQVFVSDGALKVSVADLQRFRKWMGDEASATGTGRLDFAARLDVGGDRVSLANIDLQWPDGKGVGQVGATRRSDGSMALDGELHLDVLDLGVFGGETALAHAAAFLPENLTGGLAFDWQRFRRYELQAGPGGGRIDFTLGPQRWSVTAACDTFYDGRAEAKIAWGASEGMASLKAEITLTRVAADKLLADLVERAPLSGTADLRVDLFSVGGNAEQLTAALTGEGRFNIVNGALTDPGLVRYLSAGKENLAFSQLLGSFKAGQGIVRTQDLLLRNPMMSLIGEGAVDVAKSFVAIDMHAVSRSPDGKGAGTEIKPFRIEGPISDFSTTARQ